jgi:hypothetical protein
MPVNKFAFWVEISLRLEQTYLNSYSFYSVWQNLRESIKTANQERTHPPPPTHTHTKSHPSPSCSSNDILFLCKLFHARMLVQVQGKQLNPLLKHWQWCDLPNEAIYPNYFMQFHSSTLLSDNCLCITIREIFALFLFFKNHNSKLPNQPWYIKKILINYTQVLRDANLEKKNCSLYFHKYSKHVIQLPGIILHTN